MNKICIEHLEPGMILAKDVLGADGSVLIGASTKLEKYHIAIIDDLGIGSVFIKPLGGDADKADQLRRVEKYVRQFFMYVNPDSPAFIEMFRISVLRASAAVTGGWSLPCEHDVQAKNVEQLSDLFLKDMGSPQDIVSHETELASFPDIYFKIKELLDSPTSSADEIAQVVSTDIGLSGKLLKLVNSPFYGLATHVDSIARAIAMVGMKELSTLALGISTINFFKDIPPELIDMKVFWKHSLSCGVFGKLLAGKMGLKSERFFTAGLLHDAGRLIIFKNMPYASVQALLFARRSMIPLVEAEKEVLGYDHTEIGRLLLASWKFPDSLVELIAHHHSSDSATDPREAAVIQLADNLANAADICSGGMFVLPGMADGAWERLGLKPEDLNDIFETHDRHINEIAKAFL